MGQEQDFRNQKLPPLLENVDVAFDDYDLDGKPQWLIYDSVRRKFFIIGWVENEILKYWYLGEAGKVLDAVNSQSTLHVYESDIESLLRFLKMNCLVKQSSYEISAYARSLGVTKKESWYHWFLEHYLFFRVPICYPDNFLTRTLPYARYVFHRYTLYLMTVLAIIGLYQLGMQWELFTHSFPSILTWQALFLYFIVFSVIKLCHELGHAYMCKRYNVPVPVLGVAFLVFWPVLYTDTSLSWSLNYKKRMRIALAGIGVETYLTILALLIWCNIDNNTLKTICYLVIAVNWTGSVLINVSPFMRFDGYYVLSDLLRMPNLQPRAFALTRWQIRQILFNADEPPPEIFSTRMHILLVLYSIITWVYRLVIYFGIALLVYHFFIKAVGIFLFLIEFYYFIFNPIFNELKYWARNWTILITQKRTKITLIILGALFIYICLPVQSTIEIPATLYYYHQFLFAKQEGVLKTPLPKVGTPVKANQTIAIIYSPALDFDIKNIYGEYKEKVSELRRAEIDENYSYYRPIILSNIDSQYATYEKLLQIHHELYLSVPFDGIISEIDTALSPGTYVMKDEWLADVINPSLMRVEAFVSQADISRFQAGAKGYFYPDNATGRIIPVEVKNIEILNANELVCGLATNLKQNVKESQMIETPCYNASELGGSIAVYPTSNGNYSPVESVYRVLLSVRSNENVQHVLRGKVVLHVKSTSFFGNFYYKGKQAIIEQMGF